MHLGSVDTEKGSVASSEPRVDSHINTSCGCLNVFRGRRAQKEKEVYSPLPYEDSFRLLRIEPRIRGKQLRCSLHLARLNSQRRHYEALSYAWGPEHPQVTIICNKEEAKIRRNLYHFLLRIRGKNTPRWVWVDALCINQEDEAEKGHQVSQMHAMYTKAARVLVHLGSNYHDEAHDAFAVLASVANTNTTKINWWLPRPATFSSVNKGPQIPHLDRPPDPDSHLWLSVQFLFSTPWWVRMWVLQEIVLAQQATFIWGDAEMDWKWIGTALEHIRSDGTLYARLESRGMQNAYFMYYLSEQQHLDKHSDDRPFLYLLDWARSFDVSDPRDKIYGLLGFSPAYTSAAKGNITVKPDYGLSVEAIYTDIASKIIRQDESLDILAYATKDSTDAEPPRKDAPKLPSWIPDWSQKTVRFPLMSFGDGNAYSAANGQPAQLLPSSNPDWLKIKGLQVDVVASTLPYVPFTDLRHMDEAILRHVKGCYYSALNIRDLCMTLTAGRDARGYLVKRVETHVADFAALLKELDVDLLTASWPDEADGLLNFAHEKGNAGSTREALWRYTCYRRAFVTASGKLGLGPAGMRDGDVVCVLYGAQVPFVLRAEAEHYKLVGECYILGIMDGEAIESFEVGAGGVLEKIFELR